jgi:ADP-heptose:LPS heptosyltransferase
VPTVSIFGSTEPVLTGPLGDQHTVIRHQVPCSPCFKRECPFGHYECMTLITPAQVAAAVLKKLV